MKPASPLAEWFVARVGDLQEYALGVGSMRERYEKFLRKPLPSVL